MGDIIAASVLAQPPQELAQRLYIAIIIAGDSCAAGGLAFSFDEIEAGIDCKHYVAAGYDADVLYAGRSDIR